MIFRSFHYSGEFAQRAILEYKVLNTDGNSDVAQTMLRI
ncbi:hypothetical protein PP1Y_Lpl1427 (plasmid) [Novosphingobium sp. PP1Y]|nr:hypothetical protein PP1Y_Lpl1427 [Novosphingobium sp. PP1Y]